MWMFIIGALWMLGVGLLLAFLRGASIANQCYDAGHDIAIRRALNNIPSLDFREAA